MTTTRLDLRSPQSRDGVADDELRSFLAQVLGEPFRFARFSYADELTLHFGRLRPGRSRAMRDHTFGTYIFGLRASSWLLKSARGRALVAAGAPYAAAVSVAELLERRDVEEGAFITPMVRVLDATPFIVSSAGGVGRYGLELVFSDGSRFFALPSLDEDELGTSGADDEIADWDLTTPDGLLSAWAGPRWLYEPSPLAEADIAADGTGPATDAHAA